MPKTQQHGTGAHHRVIPADEEVLGKELAVSIPDYTKSTGLQEPPDEDQGSSNSCTSQAFGYNLWQIIRAEVLRNDTYSHTFLPGGGAYLTAPIDFVAKFGALLRSQQFQEPNPETEPNMRNIVLPSTTPGRVTVTSLTRLTIHPDINTIASLLEQYKGIIIGVDGNDAGWENLTDPSYNGQAQWGHALYVYDRAVRNGKNALKAKSSWCNEVKNHFINQDYFNAGGVFEALAITAKEIDMNQYVETMNYNGTVGIFVPVSDPTQLVVLNNVFNLNLTQAPDGTIPTQKTVVDKQA